MSDPISLRLTMEELCLLQGALGIAELPGFEADLLSDLDDAQRAQALRTAAHTLRARGLVGWDATSRPRINPAVSGMLLDYAHPWYLLFVDTSLGSARVVPFLYVIGKQAIYEQCRPESDVVQLRVLNQEELSKRLFPKLPQQNPSDTRNLSWHEEIVQSMLKEGIEMARENREAASRLFSNVLSQPLAERLATAYHAPTVVQYIARWGQTPTQEHMQPDAAITIVQGHEWSFLLWVEEPQKGDESRVSIRPATNTLLLAYIIQVLPPSLDQ